MQFKPILHLHHLPVDHFSYKDTDDEFQASLTWEFSGQS